MATYRIYLETDLNRVFTKSLGPIAMAELDVVLSGAHAASGTEIDIVEDGRTSYLRFDHDGDRGALIESLSMLSATAAVFLEHSPTSLEPLSLENGLRFGTEVVTAQRYKGKTSERLTRLMLNVARAGDASKDVKARSLIDPMCGRGTTLNWALLYGIPAVGLDIDANALDDYATFLQQWAQGNRYPHRIQRYRKPSDPRHFDFTVARDREELEAKSKPDIRTFNVPADVEGLAVGKASMIVSDLPYGVQHRARTGGQKKISSVADLVESVSERWPEWIRTGGSAALSWNVKTLSKPDLIAILHAAGFAESTNRGFEHQVDRTILRDVVAANRVANSTG
jgi:hypothetical protein